MGPTPWHMQDSRDQILVSNPRLSGQNISNRKLSPLRSEAGYRDWGVPGERGTVPGVLLLEGLPDCVPEKRVSLCEGDAACACGSQLKAELVVVEGF